jgi:hypothetical protein
MPLATQAQGPVLCRANALAPRPDEPAHCPLLCYTCATQASDHMASDVPLFHSDALRPLVVDSMAAAIQQLGRQPAAPVASEVRAAGPCPDLPAPERSRG